MSASSLVYRGSGIIESTDILPIRRVVVATPKYLEKFGQPREQEDLSDHRFAHNNHVQPNSAIPFLDGNNVRPVPFEPVVLTNTIWMLESAIMSGECMALMPMFFVENKLASGELVPVLPRFRVQKLTIAAWYRKTPFTPMKIRILLNFLRQRYGDFPPWERRLLESMPELEANLGPRPASKRH